MPKNPNEKSGYFAKGKGTKLIRSKGIREVGYPASHPFNKKVGMVIGPVMDQGVRPDAAGTDNNLDKMCYRHHGHVIGKKPAAPLKQTPMRRSVDKLPKVSGLVKRGERSF